ncbi:MAG: hypothetical protein A2Z83_07720 [Omnitrophica bacterium GWA2_52_8]|nr:MAG: hypothetical protein A2Z83_07720 [Omnitrophica bacterium GWA2_52_8]
MFVRSGSVWPVYFDPNSYVPNGLNLLYGIGLLFDSVMISKMMHWLCGVLLTVCVAESVRRFTKSQNLSQISAPVFFLTPMIFNQVSTTYVDIGVSFFLFMCVYALDRFFASQRYKDLIFAGLLMSMVIAIKFYMLAATLGLVLVTVGYYPRLKKIPALMRILFVLGGATLGLCGYWFVRNLVLTGNPVFPYMGQIFGTAGFNNYDNYLNESGMAKTWLNYLLWPWNLTVRFKAFDASHWIGPFFLMTLPFCGWAIKKTELRPHFIMTFALVHIWFFTTQTARYLMPALSFWAVLSFAGVYIFYRRYYSDLLRQAGQAACAVVLGVLSLAGAYHYRVQFIPLAGVWSQHEYLMNMERSYAAATWINQNLPENAKIFNIQEVRQFYFKRDSIREENMAIFLDYSKDKTPAEVIRYLISQGFTHILDSKSVDGKTRRQPRMDWVALAEGDARLTRHLGRVISKNIRDVRYEYNIYEIVGV